MLSKSVEAHAISACKIANADDIRETAISVFQIATLPAVGINAAFDFTERRHVPLAALREITPTACSRGGVKREIRVTDIGNFGHGFLMPGEARIWEALFPLHRATAGWHRCLLSAGEMVLGGRGCVRG